MRAMSFKHNVLSDVITLCILSFVANLSKTLLWSSALILANVFELTVLDHEFERWEFIDQSVIRLRRAQS